MDKVLGIIAEYNPFHNGHLYHLRKAKELTNAKYTVSVISGNFTQRGDTSLVDKWSKTKAALSSGIDLVIELPTLYSISSAENFSSGAIKILDSLNIIDFLAFGSETDDIDFLDKLSDVLYLEPEGYKKILLDTLDKGFSFPKAREIALYKYLNLNYDCLDVISSPNNILAIEYLKALKRFNGNIKPVPILRNEVGYNDLNYSNNIASATAIREMIKNKNYSLVKNFVPKTSYSVIYENIKLGHIVPDLSAFEKEILYSLRKMDIKEIANLPDVLEGLEFAIKKSCNLSNNIYELINNIKSKRYTATRLQRIMLYALLGITKNDMEISKNSLPYVRILGFNSNGKFLLSKIAKANPNLNIVTSVKRFYDEVRDENLKTIFDKDILSTNIYTLAYKKSSLGNLDFSTNIISL